MKLVACGAARKGVALVVILASACAGNRGLLSFDEFAHGGFRAPYTLRLGRGAGRLLYYGVQHTNDSTDAQLAEIEQLWAGFHPTLAFNEGGDPPVADSRGAAVARFGEAGWLRFLAARDGVPVRSLEPPRRDEVAFLLRHFSAEQVKVFYVFRQLARYNSFGRPPEGRERYLGEQLKLAGMDGPPGTAAELLAACARLLPHIGDCRTIGDEWFNPTIVPGAFTNRASRLSGEFRDRYMIDLLDRSVKAGDRVFAVVGFGHVVMQEPVLTRRLGRQ